MDLVAVEEEKIFALQDSNWDNIGKRWENDLKCAGPTCNFTYISSLVIRVQNVEPSYKKSTNAVEPEKHLLLVC